jgi:hypothetical protein
MKRDEVGCMCDAHRMIKNACRILAGIAHEKIPFEKLRKR